MEWVCGGGGRLRDREVDGGIEHVFEGLVSELAGIWLVATTLCELDGAFDVFMSKLTSI